MPTRTYRLYCGTAGADAATELTVLASNPTTALRQLVANALLELAEQRGRYGTLTDGRRVAALLTDTSRRRYPDHGTTRTERNAPMTSTYRATENGPTHTCDACAGLIHPGQRYSRTINGRNQMRTEHLDSGCDVDFVGTAAERAADGYTTRADGDSFGPNLVVPGKPDADAALPRYSDGTPATVGDLVHHESLGQDTLGVIVALFDPRKADGLDHGQATVRWSGSVTGEHGHGCYALTRDDDAMLKARALAALEVLADNYCDGDVVEMRSSAKVCLDDARSLERRGDYTHALLRAEHGLRYYGMHPRTLESGEVVYRRLGARS